MGKRGPQPTPTAILHARGSWRAKTRPDEPQPEPGIPECPVSLKGHTKRIWTELTKDLYDAGILAKIESRTLARYCLLWSKWEAMSAFELPIETVEDLKIWDRHLAKMLALSEHLLKLEVQYGMTPASRPSVRALPPAPTPDEAEAYVRKQRLFMPT